MPGQPTRLGPFNGGLNSLSDPTAVSDSELVDVVNFELDLDGSLTSRPPITVEGATPGTESMYLLGYYIATNGTYYLLGSTGTSTYYYTGAWTLLTNTFAAVAFTQYADKAWLLAGPASANPGGSWSPSAGFVAVAAMPKGSSIISHKSRLWVSPGKSATSNGSQLRFSSVTDPTAWDAAKDFLNVNAGDGQNITDIAVVNNNIMVFKNDSTFVFSYDSGPDKGNVNKISATQGASDVNCVVQYENTVLVYHEGNVYEIINYNFSRISTKVPFTVDNTVPQQFGTSVAMSLFSDRLIVRHFDRVYVFNLRTRTWSRWQSDRIFAYFVTEPKNNLITDIPSAYACPAIEDDPRLFKIQDDFINGNSEDMTCTFRTKNYDYQISSNFKKLYWWGADVMAQGEVNVVANPIVFSFAVTWDQLDLVTWDDLETWDQPLSALPVVTTSVDALGAGNRKFLKFMKALRFRQIFFTLSIENDGTPATAPCKVFNLTTFIQTKQGASKEIS